MNPEKRRALALKLAVQVHSAADVSGTLMDTAKEFEAYLAGPDGAEIGKIYSADGEEPPHGRYIDKDAKPGAFWRRDASGWHYRSSSDDSFSEPGESWAHAALWAPMTRVRD